MIDLPIYPFTHLPIYLFTYLPIYLFTYLPIYLFTYLPIYLFTYLPIYLFTYLSIYQKAIALINLESRVIDQFVCGCLYNPNSYSGSNLYLFGID